MTGNPVKISGYAPDPLTRPPAPNLDQDGPAIRARLGPDQTAS
jgi:CoA:oxalate CoA-transferase